MYESKYFKPREFTCKCGCGLNNIADDLVKRLDTIRDIMGLPIYVNCGCRCAKHNEEVGGKKHSYHLNGMAADITLRFVNAAQKDKFKNMIVYHFDGIIEYATFFHVDVRGYDMFQFRDPQPVKGPNEQLQTGPA